LDGNLNKKFSISPSPTQ